MLKYGSHGALAIFLVYGVVDGGGAAVGKAHLVIKKESSSGTTIYLASTARREFTTVLVGRRH